MRADQLQVLASFGIVYPAHAEMLPNDWRENPDVAHDAQPALITAQNVGIPAYLANLIDPKTIRILTSPLKATEVCEEVKKGDWTTITAQFPMVESTGEVSSYGDYNNNGSVGSNYQWEPRTSYHFQTITQYGDRETEMFGLAQINYVADLNFSSALIINKFQNQSYIYGVAGLQNFGMLNDPALIAPITPTTKVGGGTTWAVALAYEVYNDILTLYTQLLNQMLGMIDRKTAMTLVMSQAVEPYLGKVTAYTVASVRDAITKEWPNLKIVTIPEFATIGGQLMQLYVDEYEGDRTAYCAFTEKMRAGRIVADLSAYKQKKIAGTWGFILRRPVAVAQMLGV